MWVAHWPGLYRLDKVFDLTLIAQLPGDAEVLVDDAMLYGLTGVYHVRDALEQPIPATSANESTATAGGKGKNALNPIAARKPGGQPVHVATVFSLDKPSNGDEKMQVVNENDPNPGNTTSSRKRQR